MDKSTHDYRNKQILEILENEEEAYLSIKLTSGSKSTNYLNITVQELNQIATVLLKKKVVKIKHDLIVNDCKDEDVFEDTLRSQEKKGYTHIYDINLYNDNLIAFICNQRLEINKVISILKEEYPINIDTMRTIVHR